MKKLNPNPSNRNRILMAGMMVMALLFVQALETASIAGLINGGSDLIADGTNAKLFDPTTPTVVINRYADNSLNSLKFIQIGFRTNNPTAFDVTSIAWSRDNSTYTAFTPVDSVSNVSTPSSVYHVSSIVSLSSVAGSPFYLRFTLPTGIEIGNTVESTFFANSDGAVQDGRLSSTINNTFLSVTRNHTAAVPEPTSLLLVLSGAGALAYRVRSNLRKRAGMPA